VSVERRSVGTRWGALVATGLLVVGASSALSGTAQAAGTSNRPIRPSPAVAALCASTKAARWMGCITAEDPGFANTPLSEVAIPGAHDSGTFNLDETDFDTQSGSDCTSYNPVFASVPALVKQWSEAQSIGYARQLDDGVRYLDVRVAFTGNEEQGWRIVHTQFSNDPLRTDMTTIADWAKKHPSEVVIVDVQHLCYDNAPTAADDADLWSDFAPLGPVSYKPSKDYSVATATLRHITHQLGGGHNVVLMLPDSVLQPATLLQTDHVHATFVTAPGEPVPPGTPTPSIPEAYAWASSVSPTSASDYDSANEALEAFPTTYAPPLGSLQGTGLYQSQLIYSLNGSNLGADLTMFETFGGLIPVRRDAGTVSTSGTLPAWELGLWTASFNRNDVLADWGHRLNVVVSDGVQYDGYVRAVVEQNAAT